ncbi:MAG: MerR family DNA-binding transcriptional regulator, partial [Patescibacteria group bacterium]
MNNLLNVLEASKVVGVSSDTIRRWDKKGLIKAQRSELNYRLFNIVELQKVQA